MTLATAACVGSSIDASSLSPIIQVLKIVMSLACLASCDNGLQVHCPLYYPRARAFPN